mgnify:FL=1
MIARYPPLAHDRHSIRIRVNEGQVILSGYVRTLATRRYFLTSLAGIAGVVGVQAEALFDDETLRLEAGQVIPPGVVVARCQYGSLVLSGQLPPGMSAADVAARVRQVPGVRRVLVLFG